MQNINGDLITLEDQNRESWDQEIILEARYFFEQSAIGPSFSKYHLESAIAREHCIANSFKLTNWKQILYYYDLLSRFYPSPSQLLNRIVAFDYVNGAMKAKREFDFLNVKSYTNNHLYYAIKADLEQKLNDKNYVKSLMTAIDLCANNKEKQFLRKKLRNQLVD